MKRCAILLLVSMLAARGLAHAQPSIDVPLSRLYRLTDQSVHGFGCACGPLCLVGEEAITGTFRLTFTSQDSLFTYYAVSDINWVVPSRSIVARITGSGTYKRGVDPFPTEELRLDLDFGTGTIMAFDSGLVMGGSDFPAINLWAYITPSSCIVDSFGVAAAPVAPEEILPFTMAGSKYEAGCFGPCTCPLSAQPVLGGKFDLVKLTENDDGVIYGVVDADWKVLQSPSPGAAGPFPVSGFGTYQVLSTSRQQRMVLDLRLDGQPTQRFDSGLVPGDGLPGRINIELSVNGFECEEQVLDIHAVERHRRGGGIPAPPPPQ